MKKFFENVESAADGGGSIFLLISVVVVAIFLAILLLSFAIIGFFKFPLGTIAAALTACIFRIIYAGVTGK